MGIALATNKEITVNRAAKIVFNPEGMTLLNIEKRFDGIEAQFKQEVEHLKAQIQEAKAQLQEDKAQLQSSRK
jgi:hypothetical protein